MGNKKTGVILQFARKANNEALKSNTNLTDGTVHEPIEGSAVREKLNADNDYVHDEREKYKNFLQKEIVGKDKVFIDVYRELKMSMDIIHGASQLMEFILKSNVQEACDEKVDKSLKSIKQNCFKLSKMVDNMMELSKITTEQYELNLRGVNIVEVVENIVLKVSEVIKDMQLHIIFDTNIEEKVILCDPEKIERMILNILSNAVRFSNMGGKISVNLKSSDDCVEIRVEAEGAVFDRHYIDGALDIFGKENTGYEDYEKGNMIELHLSKSIIELHGGTLKTNIGESSNSSFTISLPCIKTDSIYYLYKRDGILDCDNLITLINIEFSDLINTGWK